MDGDDSLSVAIVPPDDDGGANITHYKFEVYSTFAEFGPSHINSVVDLASNGWESYCDVTQGNGDGACDGGMCMGKANADVGYVQKSLPTLPNSVTSANVVVHFGNPHSAGSCFVKHESTVMATAVGGSISQIAEFPFQSGDLLRFEEDNAYCKLMSVHILFHRNVSSTGTVVSGVLSNIPFAKTTPYTVESMSCSTLGCSTDFATDTTTVPHNQNPSRYGWPGTMS